MKNSFLAGSSKGTEVFPITGNNCQKYFLPHLLF